jgi:thioredoxin-related protein
MIVRSLIALLITSSVANAAPEAFLAPEETPKIRVSEEAPIAFKALKSAYDQGDKQLAQRYADQYVRYMQRLMLEVRELSQLIGEALVRQGVVDEEDWVGVGQYLSKELARAKGEDVVGVTANLALDQVASDPQGKAEIYVFCSASSRYCREMGPDIERMWRIARRDSKIKFGLYLLGKNDPLHDKAFLEYTGITAPTQDGTELAKQFRVAFVPSVVVRAPTTNKLYLRTGVLPIDRFISLVRKVQGSPSGVTDSELQIIQAKIGYVEQRSKGSGEVLAVSYNSETKSTSLERF